MRLAAKSVAAGFALVVLAASPALADSSGSFDVSAGGNSRAFGTYKVNERAGDTRVWLKGQLNKNYAAGCDWVELGGQKLVEKCGTAGWFAIDGYTTYGILDSSATMKVCHSYTGSTTCGSKKIKW
ncbi:hypothetical protein ACFYP6_02165 [Streptomyces goshikiensis]|uniref:hypothetical protein n=1 Tax=Streptomyces goshikiensis TaxID=1942 RepID=UPI003696863C